MFFARTVHQTVASHSLLTVDDIHGQTEPVRFPAHDPRHPVRQQAVPAVAGRVVQRTHSHTREFHWFSLLPGHTGLAVRNAGCQFLESTVAVHPAGQGSAGHRSRVSDRIYGSRAPVDHPVTAVHAVLSVTKSVRYDIRLVVLPDGRLDEFRHRPAVHRTTGPALFESHTVRYIRLIAGYPLVIPITAGHPACQQRGHVTLGHRKISKFVGFH